MKHNFKCINNANAEICDKKKKINTCSVISYFEFKLKFPEDKMGN